MARWALVVVGLAGCGGAEDATLAKLDGPWQGELVTDGAPVPVLAEFEWRKADELLFGRVSLTLPGEDPSVWAVRRWEVGGEDVVYLDLTDTLDIQRGMDLDGSVGAKFEGDCTVTFECPTGVCGYEGGFSFAKGGPGVPQTPTDGTPTSPGS